MPDVVVNAALHPFRTAERVQAMAPEGLSLQAILGDAAPVFGAWLDGSPVERHCWTRTFPRRGQVVDVLIVPQKGKTLAAILSIGFAAAGAIFSGGALGGVLGAGSWGANLLGAGIGLVGKLLVSALVPPQAPPSASSEQFVRRPGIGAASNQINRYGTVPTAFGLRRIYPPYAAMPYTEIVGNDQYVRMLFAVGIGEYTCSEEKIGDTDIAEFEYEIEYGDFDDPPALYSQDIYEDTPGATLRGEVISKALANGGSTPVSGSDTAEDLHEAVRTAQPLADELSIDLLFDQGLFSVDEVKGKTRWSRAEVIVEFSPTGADTWTNFLDATGKQRSGPIFYPGETPPNRGYTVPAGSAVYIISEKRETLRVGFRWRVTPGIYDVRVRYPEYVANNDTIDEPKGKPFTWSALRTIRHQAPTNLPGTTLVAVRIKATDEGSVADRFNLLVQRLLPVWDGDEWTAPQATRRAAWAYAETLTGAHANARPLSKDRLNAAALKEWADADAAAGLTYDDIIDQPSTVFQQIRTIAGAVLAAWAIQDGKYTVVREVPQTVPVQMFTPRNSTGFRAQKGFEPLPHALRVRFINPDLGWEEDERTVYDDGYDEHTATVFETLETRGLTSASQAWMLGRRHLAQLRLRPEVYSLTTDFEHLRATRGDLVRVAHDVILVGSAWGRVKALELNGDDEIVGFTGDERLIMEPGVRYGARVRRSADAALVASEIENDATGETDAFTFIAPLDEDAIAVGDLYAVGVLDLDTAEYIVTHIDPGENLSAALRLVDAAPDIPLADSGPIPPFESSITVPTDITRIRPPDPIITGVRSDETALYRDAAGQLREQAVVSFRFAGTVRLPNLQVEGRFAPEGVDAWTTLPPVPASDGIYRFVPVEGGTRYTFQLRARNGTLTSNWVARAETVVGITTPPPDVPTLYLEGTRLRWTYPTPPPDLTGFQVRSHFGENTHWGSAAPAHGGLILVTEFDIGALGSGTRTIMVKAVDLAGNESTNAAVLVKDLGDPVTANAVETVDHRVLTWPGTVTDGAEDSGDLAADDAGDLFWSATPTDPFWTSDAADFWVALYLEMTYVATFDPDTDWIPDGSLLLDLEVEASAWTVEYRIGTGEFIAWPGRLDGLVDDTYEFRITTAAGTTQGRIVEFKIIVDLPDITETLDDVAVSSGGTRLPITKSYRAIKNVSLTVQQDGAGAISARTIDKDETLGPLVEATNAAGTAVNGTLDATIIGY